jgi:hypothetical protein
VVIVEKVCEALAYAHEEGVVHRDIKPANVMVDRRGRVKVADFGLARLIDLNPEYAGTTMTGAILGTPDYMAPEQKRGQHVDRRADIYSVGVMLYEALTGEVPQGAFEPPSKRVVLNKRLDPIVLKALAPLPEKRYQSTLELRAALAAIRPSLVKEAAKSKTPLPAYTPLPAARAHPTRLRLSRIAFIAAGAAVASASVVGWVVFGSKEREPVEKSPIALKSAAPAPVAVSKPSTPAIVAEARPRHIDNLPPGKAPPAAALGATAAPEQWRDLMAEPVLYRASSTGVGRVAGGLRLTDGGSLSFDRNPARTGNNSALLRDGALRVTSLFDKLHRVTLRARARKPGGDCYQLLAGSEGKTIEASRWEKGAKKSTVLASFPLAEPLRPGTAYTLELRIEGAMLTVSCNRAVLGTIRDEALKEGVWSVSTNDAGEPVVITGLEVLDLDAPPGQPVSSSARPNRR